MPPMPASNLKPDSVDDKPHLVVHARGELEGNLVQPLVAPTGSLVPVTLSGSQGQRMALSYLLAPRNIALLLRGFLQFLFGETVV
jgi:hypothetical protein